MGIIHQPVKKLLIEICSLFASKPKFPLKNVL
jgi:hypothetical protein